MMTMYHPLPLFFSFVFYLLIGRLLFVPPLHPPLIYLRHTHLFSFGRLVSLSLSLFFLKKKVVQKKEEKRKLNE